MRNRSLAQLRLASPRPFRNSNPSDLAGEQSAGGNLGAEFVLYNGLGTEAFNLLVHLVMAILKAPGLFTNGHVN